jgi:hypothetical protein
LDAPRPESYRVSVKRLPLPEASQLPARRSSGFFP